MSLADAAAILTPDLCVIGAGSGGLSVAAGAAQMGARVVLVERGAMGGDCLNTGCVPSKALIETARLAASWRHGAEMGLDCDPPWIDFAAISDSVQRVIGRIAPHDSVARFESLGVRVVQAEGRFVDGRKLRAGEFEIRPRRFVIATGSRPAVPAVPGLGSVPYLTNETLFANRILPEHLIIIGGGPIGLEMAQAYRRLGAEVTVLEAAHILSHDDPELVVQLEARLVAEGVTIKSRVRLHRITRDASGPIVHLSTGEQIAGTHLLVAAGRRPNTEALDLAAAGVEANAAGIVVDRRLRTSNRRIFAIGDVVGGPRFTHVAGYHAGIVIRNALFRLPSRVDYRALPWVTFTDPELAQAGMSEADARRVYGDRVEVLRWNFAANDRAQTERETEGAVKILTRRNGSVIGASILGKGAGELIMPWCLAIAGGLKIGAVANLILPYPTRGEAGKGAAGAFYTPRLHSARTRRLVRFLAKFG